MSKSLILCHFPGTKKEPSKKALNLNGGTDEARLGFAPRSQSFAKVATQQKAQSVRYPDLFALLTPSVRKSAELAKAILTTINSAIKKSHTRWLLLMAGTTRLSWPVRIKRVYGFSFQKLRFFQRKVLRTLLTGRSNSGRFRTTCSEFSPLYSTTFDKKNKSDKRTLFFVNGGNDEARTRDLMRDRHAL